LESSDANLQSIVQLAQLQSNEQGAIIAFANSHYIEVLMNWLVALESSGIRNYVIVALDQKLFEYLAERYIPTAFSGIHGGLRELWSRRIQVFAALCAAGVDFIHSDVDAVWLRNPCAEFFSRARTDLIISQGTVWPPDVHRQFGFVLCCGLFKLKSSELSRALLRELSAHVLTTGDDQISLNRLIAQRVPLWQLASANPFHVRGPGADFICAESMFDGVCADGLRVSILPHRLFQRVPMESGDAAYVKHLLTRKDPAEKMLEFARHGCAFLRPDWRQLNFDVHSLHRLRRVAVSH
jgi:hypothetical protein